MNQIILTTPEELRAIVSESVSQTLAGLTLPKDEPDNLTPDAAVGVLEQHGFLISKARLYKLTAKGNVPFRKYGNKLLFSRRELLVMGRKPRKTCERQGRGGTRHRQKRKPKTPQPWKVTSAWKK